MNARLLPAAVSLALLLAAGLAAGSGTQQADPPAAGAPAAQTAPATQPVDPRLPDAWMGSWRGEAQVVLSGGRIAGRYTMGLDISPAAGPDGAVLPAAGAMPVYNWAITYESGDEKQTRPYLLRVATDDGGKPLPGHYVLDERNGILVDQFLVGQAMHGHFNVYSGDRRQVLHARYELISDEAGRPALRVEIASFDGTEVRSGGAGGNGVESHRLIRVQKALLLRQP